MRERTSEDEEHANWHPQESEHIAEVAVKPTKRDSETGGGADPESSDKIDKLLLEQLGEFSRSKTEQFKETAENLEMFVKEIREKFSATDQKEIYDALMLMFTVHIYQEDRPDGKPYVSHPLSVSKKVLEMSPHPNKELVIAALLHDSVEDQADKLASLSKENPEGLDNEQRASLVIEKKYGQRVKNIVAHLSNPDFDSILERQGVTKNSPDYQNQKNRLYAEHVAEAIKDPEVLMIKLADFSENALKLSALPTGTEKQRAKRNKLKSKYLPVMKIFIEKLGRDNLYPEYKQKLEQEMQLLVNES